ncbi:uncharacterized protein A1O9_12907 [Exophiala aquamarina CBS 119918]|uniref:Zn(2)-C6 fungal-type domain-containing protein n=1 Tax=Exophiala aquamarina CBS 119918 TaxID=1182545 RepID=A0A072NVE8_9EURO|nr:uncharacterized protein A1O9_12907 [Exophiala aquamarina CBS 119918]KEF51023.1 hypothetical protein A1O9_12907 [Exophiala aquamarina CBS 119918]
MQPPNPLGFGVDEVGDLAAFTENKVDDQPMSQHDLSAAYTDEISKRKKQRGTQTSWACTRCRKRKIKCSKDRPGCGRCLQDRALCVYMATTRSRTAAVRVLGDHPPRVGQTIESSASLEPPGLDQRSRARHKPSEEWSGLSLPEAESCEPTKSGSPYSARKTSDDHPSSVGGWKWPAAHSPPSGPAISRYIGGRCSASAAPTPTRSALPENAFWECDGSEINTDGFWAAHGAVHNVDYFKSQPHGGVVTTYLQENEEGRSIKAALAEPSESASAIDDRIRHIATGSDLRYSYAAEVWIQKQTLEDLSANHFAVRDFEPLSGHVKHTL